MKLIRLIQVIFFLMISSTLLSQAPDLNHGNEPPSKFCEDFSHGNGTWMGRVIKEGIVQYYIPSNYDSGASGDSHDRALYERVEYENQIIFNQFDFKGNLPAKGNYLTFDFKVGGSQSDDEVSPKLYFYLGQYRVFPEEVKFKAIFHFNKTVTSEDGWTHFSIPITPKANGKYPESELGYWEIINGDPRNFGMIMSECMGAYFDLNLKNTPEQSYSFDNICFENLGTDPSDKINENDNQASEQEVILTRVYPNPGNGMFNVSLEKPASGFLEVFNSAGTVVHRQEFTNKNDLRFDISGKTKGIYIMRLTMDGFKTQNIRVVLK